ncbi:hypothetical protein B0O80DRAFT_10775 [Mortierella sp. GBAus27b]|nr:hypothetical protein B0O80DRAFT_10775 [Mortierella sp. GBAus27b]
MRDRVRDTHVFRLSSSHLSSSLQCLFSPTPDHPVSLFTSARQSGVSFHQRQTVWCLFSPAPDSLVFLFTSARQSGVSFHQRQTVWCLFSPAPDHSASLSLAPDVSVSYVPITLFQDTAFSMKSSKASNAPATHRPSDVDSEVVRSDSRNDDSDSSSNQVCADDELICRHCRKVSSSRQALLTHISDRHDGEVGRTELLLCIACPSALET